MTKDGNCVMCVSIKDLCLLCEMASTCLTKYHASEAVDEKEKKNIKAILWFLFSKAKGLWNDVIKYVDDNGVEIAEDDLNKMIDEIYASADEEIEAILNNQQEIQGLDSLKFKPGSSYYICDDEQNDGNEREDK